MLSRTVALASLLFAARGAHGECADKYLTFDTDAADLSDESLQLPIVHGIRAITLWFYVYESQDDYVWDYIIDARNGLPSGWVSFVNYPTVRFGSGWAKAVVDTADDHNRVVFVAPDSHPMRLRGGRWIHLYVESTQPFDDGVSIFAKSNNLEDLSGDFLAVSLWGRPLTDDEISELAAGGIGPSERDPTALLAHYNAAQANLDDAEHPYVPDATGSPRSAKIRRVLDSHPATPVVTRSPIDRSQKPGLPAGCLHVLTGAPSPPPPPPLPPRPACTTKYLRLDTNASDSNDQALHLPRLTAIRAVSMWVYVQAQQDDYYFDYLLDARPGLHSGWVAYDHFPSLRFGSGWARARFHRMDDGSAATYPAAATDDAPATTLDNQRVRLPGGHWAHLYFEATEDFADDLTVLSKYTMLEDCAGLLISVSVWSRALSDAEVDDLAGGGIGPSMSDADSLLASFNAENADMAHSTIKDATGRKREAHFTSFVGNHIRRPAAEIEDIASLSGTDKAGLPSCIPILYGPLPAPAAPPAAPSAPPFPLAALAHNVELLKQQLSELAKGLHVGKAADGTPAAAPSSGGGGDFGGGVLLGMLLMLLGGLLCVFVVKVGSGEWCADGPLADAMRGRRSNTRAQVGVGRSGGLASHDGARSPTTNYVAPLPSSGAPVGGPITSTGV